MTEHIQSWAHLTVPGIKCLIFTSKRKGKTLTLEQVYLFFIFLVREKSVGESNPGLWSLIQANLITVTETKIQAI